VKRVRGGVGIVVGAALCCVVPARADLPSTCAFGGPAGTFSVAQMSLPAGAPQLAMRITTPAQTPTEPTALVGGRTSWHLATGVAVVDARTGRLVASRYVQSGSSPRRVVIAQGGTQVVREDVVGPGAPFNHQGGTGPDSLRRGNYYVLAFGSDGDARLPNPWWSAEITFGGTTSCVPFDVRGAVYDHDQTDFTGTQVSAYGPGEGSGLGATWTCPHRLLFGVLDAASQLAGSSTLSLRSPDGRRHAVTNALVSFTGGRGRYAMTGSYQGLFPLLLATAMSVDVPVPIRSKELNP
jgi:hypothetical protein